MSPSPIVIPGNIVIGLRGTVHHNFGNEDRMVVRIDKLLLGQWTTIPCANNMGSWYFLSNDKTSFFLSFMSVIFKNYTNVINHQVLLDGLSRDVAFILNTGNEILRIG